MIGKNGSYFHHDLTLNGHYIVTGNTNDNFCNDLLQITDVRQEIHRHLREQGFDAVFFFDYSGMLYCYDYRSYNILVGTDEDTRPQSPQEQFRDEFDDVEEEGPLGSALPAFRQANARQTAQPDRPAPAAVTHQLHMGTRNMAWAWNQVIALLRQGKHRCALVLSNINSMQTSFPAPALQALQELTSSRSEKPSIAVYLFRGNTMAEMLTDQAAYGTPEWNIFFHSVLRPAMEAEDADKNRVISLRTPNAAEVQNLLNYLRTKPEYPLTMDVRQIRQLSSSLSYGCARENWPLKQLRSRLEHYVQEHPEFILNMDNYSQVLGLPRHTTALEDLQRLVGLHEVKREIQQLYDSLCAGTVRVSFPAESTRFAPLPATNYIRNHRLNICFMGNPGTGKTELARLMGRLYYEAGVLPQGHLVEASAGNIVTQNVGGTAANMRELVQQAMGGVLFIDEAYALLRNAHGREAIDQLVNDITAYEGQFAVILAGYTRRMERFLKANEGLASRIGTTYHLPDYSAADMQQLLNIFLERDEDNLVFSDDLQSRMQVFCSNWANDHGSSWGNAREAGRLVGLMKQSAKARLQRSRRYSPGQVVELTLDDLPEKYRKHLKPKAQSLEEALQEMENMHGLHNVKVYLKELVDSIRWGASKSGPGRFIFHGPPGTGKTHVARLMGVMLQKLGVLKRDYVYEVAAQDLLRADESIDYGDNPNPTPQEILQAAVDNARGGILFIDEAHQLNTDEGRALIRALVPIVENPEYRKDTCFILAGYSAEMRELLRQDQGLSRRFPEECRIRFDHYTAGELRAILEDMARERGEIPLPEYLDRTQVALNQFLLSPPENYGDAGFIRDTYLPRSIKARTARLNQRYTGDRNGLVSPEVAETTPEKEKRELTAQDIPDQFKRWAGPLGLPVPKEKTIWERIDDLVGKPEVQKYLRDRQKQQNGLTFYDAHANVGLNFAVVGPPGSGRHTVIRTMTALWKHLGLLDREDIRFVSKGDLEAGYVGQTAIRTSAIVEQAIGGCLAVEYPSAMLSRNSHESSFGADALGVISGAMGITNEKLSVVFLDTPEGIEELFRQAPSIKSQISHVFRLDNLSPDDMLELFRIKTGYSLTFEEDLKALLPDFFLNWVSQRGGLGDSSRSWGNGTEVDHLTDDLIARWESHNGKTVTSDNIPMRLITRDMFPEDLQKYLVRSRADKDTAMKELMDLTGLNNVKTVVRNLETTIRVTGTKCAPGCYAFLGNPGTGKTTVARLMGGVLRAVDVLSQGHVIERTAQQIMHNPEEFDETIKLARDGILFIDEAPQLAMYDRGLAIIHRLLTVLEDPKVTSRTCIILAGYRDPMMQMFSRDSGLASRFGTDEAKVYFEDYTATELMKILDDMAARADKYPQIPVNHPLILEKEFRRISGIMFDVVTRRNIKDFGNARFVRNYLRDCCVNMFHRVDTEYPDGNYPEEALYTLTEEDVTEKGKALANASMLPALVPANRLDTRTLPQITSENYAEAVDYYAQRTVLLDVMGSGTGSGTIISPDGHILTCTHVIANAKKIRAKVYCPGNIGSDYRWFDCLVLYPSCEDCDMALLKMEGTNFPFMPIRPANQDVLVTEQTLLMGYPLGGMLNDDRLDELTASHFEGRISSSQVKARHNRDILHYYLDSKGLHGNSGSPVISQEDGRLIGVFSGSIAPKTEGNLDELNLFFPIGYFWQRFVSGRE